MEEQKYNSARRKKVIFKKGFSPDHDYVKNAVREFLDRGGKIKVVTMEDVDFSNISSSFIDEDFDG